MTPLIVLALQCSLSLLAFYLLGTWYLLPKITSQGGNNIFSFFLIVNIFRYLPLSLYMPGQVAPDFPDHVKQLVAGGDLISGILALAALILLRSKNKIAFPFIWMFSLVSVADIFLALYFAMKEKVYELALGANYFTVSVYVPMLIVIQYFLFKLLISKIKHEKQTYQGR